MIEFGPGIFGVGTAASHYFNKKPADVTPLEAAFFGSILPSPRRRYIQYCRGELSRSWERYVRRILRRMHQRGKVTDVDYEAAKAQKIVFARDFEQLSESDCKARIKEGNKAWTRAYLKRLKQAVLRAAPHQLRMYLKKKN